MLKKIILLSIIVGTAFSLNNAAYCNIKSCDKNSHTVCKYPSKYPAPTCGKVLKVGLTLKEKKKILKIHNDLRKNVAIGNETRGYPGPQPKATNMQRLHWDKELAAVAQRWANQCIPRHDECWNVDRFPVGQNVGYKGTTGDVNSIDVGNIVKDWYEEVKNCNGRSVSRYGDRISGNGGTTTHYTQLVWAKRKYVGCGGIKYPAEEYNRFLIVCNYGPGGNTYGKSMYQTA